MNRVLVLRTEGSVDIGLGHIRRCLSLANAFRDGGWNCSFVVHGSSDAAAQVEASGFAAELVENATDIGQNLEATLAARPSAVVVDSYLLGRAFFEALTTSGVFSIAIEDFTNRKLPVPVVVNAARKPQPHSNGQTLFLNGPSYALLRPEFERPPADRSPCSAARRILIMMGGSDALSLSPRIVEWLQDETNATFDVVVGPMCRSVDALQRVAEASRGRVVLHRDPPRIRDLMLHADLAVSAAGQTLFELAATATPAIAVLIADNQIMNLELLTEAGAALAGGCAEDPELRHTLVATFRSLVLDQNQRLEIGRRGRALVDGAGARRVARLVTELVDRRALEAASFGKGHDD